MSRGDGIRMRTFGNLDFVECLMAQNEALEVKEGAELFQARSTISILA